MKNIYVFKLCNIDDITDKVRSDLNLIAYLLYDRIGSLCYGMNGLSLVENASLKYNNICDFRYDGEYNYKLSVDSNSEYGMMYNPTLFSETSFGITVCNGYIDENDLYECIRNVQAFARTEYVFQIESISYRASSYDDETKRMNAINNYFGKKEIVSKGYKLTRNRFSLLSMISGMGR